MINEHQPLCSETFVRKRQHVALSEVSASSTSIENSLMIVCRVSISVRDLERMNRVARLSVLSSGRS